MSLDKYTDEELKRELFNRQSQVNLEEYHKPPENVRPYEEVESLTERSWHSIYIGQISDGCEGQQFMIQTHRDTPEEEIMKMVKDHVIKAWNIEWSEDMTVDDMQIEEITFEEFGRYGFFCLRELNTKDSA